MKAVCVFCGSNLGARPSYSQAAKQMGEILAQKGITLVYGGGNVGLMGLVADAALAAGGEVIGVIPKALVEKEIGHSGLSKLHVVNSMHERKELMASLSDAFVALPGGYGTLEEFAEVLTWTQLGLQQKPCGLLNIEGFYDSLCALFDRFAEERFLRLEHRSLAIAASDATELLEKLASFKPIQVRKWIDRDPR